MLLPLLLILVAVSANAQEQECPGLNLKCNGSNFYIYVVADWFDAGNLGCYKFLDGKVNLTWVEAQLACEQQGGYLAEPTSELWGICYLLFFSINVQFRQMDFLSELALLEGGFTGVGYWYIGLTDLGKNWMIK